MDFDHYQEIASGTDQFVGKKAEGDLMIPLLGIAGETGTLLAEFKKKIRDKESYDGFDERAEEELGDILWYLSNIATRLSLSLSEIASKNLHKTQERWPIGTPEADMFHLFDEGYPESEQLPRILKIKISDDPGTKIARVINLSSGEQIGDQLTDNAHEEDGYRYHDVIHYSFMAILGWSPVLRKLLGKKRRSNPRIDEVEDGARASILEELLIAFVYSNASERSFYDKIKHLDSEMLSTIKRIVTNQEVGRRTTQDWERAILSGYTAFRYLRKHRKGKFLVDLNNRTFVRVK